MGTDQHSELRARVAYLERQLYGQSKPADSEGSLQDFSPEIPHLETQLAEILRREQEERSRAEEALSVLRHTEQRFRALFDSNVIGIIEINRDRVLDANGSFLEMTGHTREAVLRGELILSEISPVKYHRIDELAHERAIREGSFPPFEKEFLRADGVAVPVWVGGVLLRPPPDWTCMAFVLDLSERKLLEEQFHTSEKLKSLGLLSSVIAHDFNNLLTTMIGNASMSLDTLPPDHPARGHIEEVLRASRLASGLTSQLVGYSSKTRSKSQVVELSKLAREIGDLVELPLSRKVELRWSLVPGLPPIYGDAYLIQQILMNLVINASDALGQTAGQIHLATYCREYATGELQEMTMGSNLPAGRYVAVEVHDNGCGMSEEVKAKIFDPMFTTKAKGRGLGLAATLGIVRSHHGAIQVRSKPGEGTTFTVLFPASLEGMSASPPTSAEGNLRGTGTVLVVDDEPGVRRLAEAALSGYGYRVLMAADGREGIEIYRKESDSISLIIMDLSMPVMSGEEALAQLLAIRQNPPVLFSSGFNTSHTLRSLNGYPFIQKPYTPRELAEKVRELHSAQR